MCRGLYLLICLAVVLGATLDAGAALVAHWRLDEGTGTTAYDATGNGYDGTIMGNPTWVAGVFKGALSLDGNGDYINLGSPPDWPAGRSPRSLCGWGLTNTVATGYRWFAAYGTAGTSQACFIGMNGTRAIGGGYNADDVEMADFWTVGEWHHLALTYDGTTARLYADAVEIASAAKNWDLVLNRAYIGEQVNGAGELWNGIIDEVCVFDQALTPAEIADVMAGMNVELADDPSPEDEAVDVPREVELTGCVTMELADGCMLGVGVYAGGGVRKGVLDGLSTG
ncbi:MAG: LamG domain-containing protein [Phycisphaerae bacterium]|nr:LamG domain-containing protein [Phycisphaerae bacterium]